MKNLIIEILSLIMLCLTGIAGVLSMPEIGVLPAEYLRYVPLVMIVVLGLKQALYIVLDLADDGVRNGSYKVPPVIRVLGMMLLPCCLLSCVNSSSSDSQLAWARAGVVAAEFSLDLAEIGYASKMANPDTPPAQKLMAEKVLKAARERLEKERAKLIKLQDLRANPLLLPPVPVVPDSTSAKDVIILG